MHDKRQQEVDSITQKRIDDPREYLSQLTVLLTASSIVIPNGHAVSLLREIKSSLGDDARGADPILVLIGTRLDRFSGASSG